MEEKNGFGYFLLGLGLGMAAGVLLAPKAGSETREFLRSKAEEGSDYVRTRASDGREYLKKRGEDIRDSASEILERGKSAVKSRRDHLTAAVEAGKQAYRDAVSSFESGEGV
jgi:gas vesicle protein